MKTASDPVSLKRRGGRIAQPFPISSIFVLACVERQTCGASPPAIKRKPDPPSFARLENSYHDVDKVRNSDVGHRLWFCHCAPRPSCDRFPRAGGECTRALPSLHARLEDDPQPRRRFRGGRPHDDVACTSEKVDTATASSVIQPTWFPNGSPAISRL